MMIWWLFILTLKFDIMIVHICLTYIVFFEKSLDCFPLWHIRLIRLGGLKCRYGWKNTRFLHRRLKRIRLLFISICMIIIDAWGHGGIRRIGSRSEDWRILGTTRHIRFLEHRHSVTDIHVDAHGQGIRDDHHSCSRAAVHMEQAHSKEIQNGEHVIQQHFRFEIAYRN